MDDAGVTDQDVHRGDLGKGFFDRGTICNIAADGGCAGGFCHSAGGFVFLFIKKEHTMALLGKQFYGCSTDSAAAAGDDHRCHIIFFCSWSGGRNTAG